MQSFFSFSLFFVLAFVVNAQEKWPRWITDPYQECSSMHELCVVGEASGLMAAEISARNAMARIFESNVSSVTISQTEMSQDESKQQSEERFTQTLKVESKFLLRGAVVKKSHLTNESVFVLLSLKKDSLARDLKEQMKHLDDENEQSFKDRRRSMISKIQNNLELRAQYNQTYRFLTNNSYPATFTQKTLANWRTELRRKDSTVLVNMPKETNESFRHLILTELLQQHYRVIETSGKAHQFQLKVRQSEKPQHLKVKGFVKYEFGLELTAFDKNQKKLGHVNLSTQETGRHKDHAFETAAPKFTELLNQNFDKLNMND